MCLGTLPFSVVFPDFSLVFIFSRTLTLSPAASSADPCELPSWPLIPPPPPTSSSIPFPSPAEFVVVHVLTGWPILMIVCQFVLFFQSRVQFSSSRSSVGLQNPSPHQHVSVNGTCRRTALPSALLSESITLSRSLLHCSRHYDRARLHWLCHGFIHFFKLNINNRMFICCPLVTPPDMTVSDISEVPFFEWSSSLLLSGTGRKSACQHFSI